VLPLAPLAPLDDDPLDASPRMAAHPEMASATASRPAMATLWCDCFMINSSFGCLVGM
jgi:hypothetical protein